MPMPAAKHMDPVMGVDTHIVMIPSPAGPIPTPLPHPYVGMLLDPADYLPFVGATVKVNGLPRAVAGTSGQAMPPHIPMGGPFMKPPTFESEMFMGSITVNADGDPMSFAALPVLSCQDIGIPAPPRPKKKSPAKSLMLPVSVVMPIPGGPPVLVGGAPIPLMPGIEVLLGPLAKGLAKARKSLAKKSKRFARAMKAVSDRLHKLADAVLDKLKLSKNGLARNRVHRSICTVTGHPVDIATGKVFTDFTDLTLLGPLPFVLERVWYSSSTYEGPFGHGWHSSCDMALAVSDKVIGIRLWDGRAALFPPIALGRSYYDPAERMTLARDHHGYALTDSQGLTYRFAEHTRRADQPLSSISDRHGHTLRFHYEERGLLCRIVDSSGRPWDLHHDTNGHVVSISGPHPTDPAQEVTVLRCVYDGHDNLVEVSDALGHPQRFVYQRHLLTKETNRNGLSFYFEYDGLDDQARCLRTWGDDGIYNHKLTYDETLCLTVVENSLGHKTTYFHDGAMVHKVVDPYGNTSTTEFDEGYRVVASTDELGQRTTYAYDERGNLTQRTGPDGAKLTIENGPSDLPIRVVDPVEGEWLFARDGDGRLVERKDPLGRTTKYHYQGPWLVGVTDPTGAYTGVGYDSIGNPDAIATADGAMTRFAHDRWGRVVAVTDAKGNTQTRDLDLLGRVVQVTEPDGNIRALAYDREGNVVHAKDKQHDVRFTYQGMGRLSSRSEAGTTVRFEYDTEEQLIGIVNEHGRVYRFKLGPTGEVEEESGFDGLSRKYTRDKAGRVTRVTRPQNRTSDYKHDPAGRVTSVKHSDGTSESYAYRLDGELVGASNQSASVLFERDVIGRITKEKQGKHWVASEYDAMGLRSRFYSSLGADQRITRNAMGDVLAVEEALSGFNVAFKRDLVGLEVERSLPGGLKSRWQRDKLGRPLQHTVGTDDKTLRAAGYKWESNDRLKLVIDGLKGPTQYGHDALGNLAWAQYPDGAVDLRMPDAVGNLFRTEDRKDREYGPAGQLLAARSERGTTHYRYDAEGNLVEKVEPDGKHWSYEWNSAGMLSKVLRPDGTEVRFEYDALGRRLKKTHGDRTTTWIWDGNNPLHEQSEGKVRAAPITWLFEPESFAPMAKIVEGSAYAITTDHLGTPVLMTDAQGQPVFSANISAYGQLRDLEGDRQACPFRWPGQYEDEETGLYYNRFRYYDPEAGGYVSQDPLRLRGGLRLYGYVADTLSTMDPLGLVVTNKFPQEELPRDGKVFPQQVVDGKVKLDKPGAREFDFVVTKDDQLVVGKRHHLLGNREDVQAAGQMKIRGDGRVVSIDNLSGHYRPTPAETEQFATALRRAGVDPNGATLTVHEIDADADGNVLGVRKVKQCKVS